MKVDWQKYDLISIDIFDTLLFRALAQPVDLFIYVWEKVIALNLNLVDLSPLEFQKLRIEMERRSRIKAVNKEVNLDDIYKELPKSVVHNIDHLKEIELDTEKDFCYPNWEILNLVKEAKRAGLRVSLVSDMYLTQAQILNILESNYIDTYCFDNIIVSTNEKCSKQNGELFQVLFNKHSNIPKKRILHIGDNKNSDYIQALKSGINAYHYDIIPDKLYSIYDYEKIRYNCPQKEIISLRKLAASIFAGQSESEKIAFEIGASIIGPFLTLYIGWVCDRLNSLGINRIYPLMREGYLLGELLKREAEYRGQKLYVKPIYVSRKATYLPSISEINKEEIENLIGARNLTISEAIDLVGLNSDNFVEILDYMNVSFKESHKININESLTLKEYIIKRFLEEKEKIEAYVESQRDLLNDYLIQEIGEIENVATIDIGFFGRIQKWMEKSLDIGQVSHQIKHFLAIGVVGEKFYDGINYEGFCSTFSENMDLIPIIHRTTDILEKLISVTEGSTIGYKKTENKIIPIKSFEVHNKDYLDKVFEGIFKFQEYWFSFEKLKPKLAKNCKNNKRETLMILHRLIDLPRLTEVNLLSKFEADTNFGTQYNKKIITDENKDLLQKKGIDFIDKCNVSYTYQDNNIVWPKGLITLYDEYYYLKRALKNNAGNEIIKSMLEVIERVAEQGIKEVALYGAGENGRQFLFLCNMYHIKVNCFIDRKESLWGTQKEGIPVIGLYNAIKEGVTTYVITSLFSINEIKFYIEEQFKYLNSPPTIFNV